MLNLYRLEREGGIGFDEVKGFVIAAATEFDARVIAMSQPGDEGPFIWRDIYCECIGTTTTLSEGVVLGSFNPG